MLLAATAAPAFFSELAILFVASALLAFLGHRLRVLPIVSFLVAGALIGPHALGLVRDEALIEAAAEVGVMLLLFSIGIEFSLEKLARLQRLILVGGGLQIGLTLLLVTLVLRPLGVGWAACVFTGFLVSLSSTAIVMKLLMDWHETPSEGGQASLGILIFQDLAVVGMVLVVPMLGGDGEAGSMWGLAATLVKAVAIVVGVLVLARKVMPKVLEAVARTCSHEIFLLTVVAICFGTAWLTSLAGVSLSLGAFLAGLVISESRFSDMAFGEILPLQVLFSATFFVSVGLLVDLRFFVERPLLILAGAALVLVVKLAATATSLKILGYGGGTVAFSSLMLAQVGEFSFVLERAGRETGLFPAGLEDGGSQAFIATTVLLMTATPLLAGLGRKARRRHAGSVRPADESAIPDLQAGAEPPLDHVLIAGYGETGRALAQAFDARSLPYLILTLSPDGAREAEAAGRGALRGNYSRRHELTRAKIEHARLLVVADDELDMTRRVVSAARTLRPDLPIVARVRFATEVEGLLEAGATRVVADDRAARETLVDTVLDGVLQGTTGGRSAMETIQTVELDEPQKASRSCRHVGQTQPVEGGSRRCEECLAMGESWVHLRICMTCGHVGCCDSSKNKHASRHFRDTGHPIVKSYEPGEDWAWCYEDELLL